jgi:ATP-dependent DNA ligase
LVIELSELAILCINKKKREKKMAEEIVHWKSDILYRKNANGTPIQWQITVVERGDNGEAFLHIETGQVAGKKTVNERKIVGKNKGKRNETTDVEQALAEAKKRMEDQIVEKQYSKELAPAKQNPSDNEEEEDDDEEEEEEEDEDEKKKPNKKTKKTTNKNAGNLAMLAKTYIPGKTKLKFPVFVQPKLDGVRALGGSHSGLHSRNNRPFRNDQRNLRKVLAEIQATLPADLILDGEIYTHELSFQRLTGLVSMGTANEAALRDQEKLQWHIFDCVVHDKPFPERYKMVKDWIEQHQLTSVVLVPTEVAHSEEDIQRWHDFYVSEGYEGLMIRTGRDNGYDGSGRRSPQLLKYKMFKDEEFEVVGWKTGSGRDTDTIVLQCRLNDGSGRTFDARPRGSWEFRNALLLNAGQLLGQPYTIRFQNLTDDGFPRFPTGVAPRNYE